MHHITNSWCQCTNNEDARVIPEAAGWLELWSRNCFSFLEWLSFVEGALFSVLDVEMRGAGGLGAVLPLSTRATLIPGHPPPPPSNFSLSPRPAWNERNQLMIQVSVPMLIFQARGMKEEEILEPKPFASPVLSWTESAPFLLFCTILTQLVIAWSTWHRG